MMIKSWPVFLVLCCCSCLLSFGQDPYSVQFNTHNGLPSSEVYDVAVDSNGVVWICTDRGICNYNGHEFKRFTTSEGLSNNTILEVHVDPEGQLWFSGLDGTLSHTVPGGVAPFKGNNRLVPIVGKDRLIKHIFWGDDGSLYLIHTAGRSSFCLLVSPDGEFVQSVGFDELAAGTQNGAVHGLRYAKIGGEVVLEKAVAEYETRNNADLYYLEERFVPILVRGQFDRPDFKQEYEFTTMAHDLYCDEEGDLWVSTGNGVFRFADGDLDSEPEVYFEGVTCSSSLRDSKGNLWVSTLERGVLMVPSFKFQRIGDGKGGILGKTVTSLSAGQRYLSFGTMEGRLMALDSTWSAKEMAFGKRFFGNLGYMTQHGNRTYVNRFILEESEDGLQLDSVGFRTSLPLTFERDNGDFISAGHSGFAVYGNENGDFLYNSGADFGVRIFCVAEFGETLWFGMMGGLLRVDGKNYSGVRRVLPEEKLLQCRVNDIAVDEAGNLWLATIGNGLLYLNGDSLIHVGEADGMHANMINKVALDGSGRLWAASNAGLFWVEYENAPEFSLLKVRNLSTEDGLPTNFVRDVVAWQGHVWMGTDDGLIHFDPQSFENMDFPEPVIIMEEVLVNGDAVDYGSPQVLEEGERDVLIRFVGVSNRRLPGQKSYRYRLMGADSTWMLTDDRSIHYCNLESGDYQFEVAVRNRNGGWSLEPAVFAFTVQPSFWETGWFYGGMVLLLFVLLIGAYRFGKMR